eukprot:jgi/Picre1/34596/NNA_002064.t1
MTIAVGRARQHVVRHLGTTPGEVVNHRVSEIRGSLPSWLHGTFYRNGPGTYENGTDGGMLHLFDGYGMVVKIDMDGRTNEATISNAFVKSKAYTRYKETGVMEWREFGTPKVVVVCWRRFGML